MKKIIFMFVAMTMAGCSSAPPTIQQGANAEVSYDGLHAIDNSIFKAAWADPDIDFTRYSKIMPGGAFFEYRAVKKTSGTQRARSSNTEFYIDEKAREQLKALVSEIFNEELAKSSRFSVTDAPGSDVLSIRGGLYDIVSNVPPDPIGRGDIYLSSVGEITLILEAVDSMSGEVIFRAVERRAAERGGGMAMRSNSVTTRSEVRRLIRRWATKLREGLDSIPAK
ncbi:MAG: DUF3313 family protein [Proteobacteria bacterium]|nr:DUF3313 family protein [Pseudomonadota bacterium]